MFINYSMVKTVLDQNIDSKVLPDLRLDTYISKVLDDEEITKEVEHYQHYQRQPDGHDDFIRGIHIGSKVIAKIIDQAYHEHSVGKKIELIFPDMLEIYKCDQCNNTIESSDNYCCHCGVRFEGTVTKRVKE